MNNSSLQLALNSMELKILGKLHDVNMALYIAIKGHLLKKYNEPCGIERRHSLLEVIKRRNPRSVYNVLYRFRDCGLFKVKFLGRKGIEITLVHADAIAQNAKKPADRLILIKAGEQFVIKCEEDSNVRTR